MSDPTAQEMREYLREQGFTDDWDIEPAIYWFAHDYHGGQASNLYSALSASQYKPSLTGSSTRDEWEGAQAAYESLYRHYKPTPVRDQ